MWLLEKYTSACTWLSQIIQNYHTKDLIMQGESMGISRIGSKELQHILVKKVITTHWVGSNLTYLIIGRSLIGVMHLINQATMNFLA